MLRLASIFVAAAALLAGCHPDKGPEGPKPGEQPLPPASGTAVGYLLDNSGQLALNDKQFEELRAIDASLAARNDAIDTQLREIERPEEGAVAEPDQKETSMKPNNWAPGAIPVRSTADSGKLHETRTSNVKEALAKVWTILDTKQQETATRLLADRGITAPPVAKPVPAPADATPTATPDTTTSDTGTAPATPRDEP